MKTPLCLNLSQKIFVALFTLLLPLQSFAAIDSTALIENYFTMIDGHQRRIDQLDGSADDQINIGDVSVNLRSTKVYLKDIDTTQKLILNSSLGIEQKESLAKSLISFLETVNPQTYKLINRNQKTVDFLYEMVRSSSHNKLLSFLQSDPEVNIRYLNYFKTQREVSDFLKYTSSRFPDLVFKAYKDFADQPYALEVVEFAAKTAPVSVKKYFISREPIFILLNSSQDSAIQTLINIKEKYSLKTNAYTLLHDIVNGNLTMSKADAEGSDPEKYLKAMLRIRSRPNPLGSYSLDKELEVYALKFVRVLNDLHNDRDNIRFASIENFTAEEIYTLMVYSEEEIFTSSFNGLFSRLLVKLGPVSGYEFLDQLGNNRFRTFIKMCAGFGKLSAFLNTMTTLQQQLLMIKFAGNLEIYSDLSEAVEVADAYGSITDSLIDDILISAIRYNFAKQLNDENTKGEALYGLLNYIFTKSDIRSEAGIKSDEFKLPVFDRVKYADLLGADGISRWLVYFYDDEDGDASFTSFTKTFADSDWQIEDKKSYVLIKSKSGTPIHIYANKPKHEYDGQEAIESLFEEKGFQPNVMVHRGHSYYAYKTIEKVTSSTEVFILGSCGGYHSISTIIERSPDVSIVSSKQIGTQFVNNPMLKLMAEKIRTANDLDWADIWSKLENDVKINPKTYERFLDYIPPHKNLGAIFIKAYKEMAESFN